MRNSSGQALLLVLLSMAVVLVVVLSILSKSITDIAVTSREEEAQRAFSAAEAGIERILISATGAGIAGTVGNASFNATVTSYGQGGHTIILPSSLASGDSATIWFVDHAPDGTLICTGATCFTGSPMKVCWGETGTANNTANTPAIETTVFYANTPGNYATVRVARDATDPNTPRQSSNSFAAPDPGTCTIDSQVFPFQKTIAFNSLGIPASVYNQQNGLLFVRLRLIYNSDKAHPVGLDVGTGTLPAQGSKVESIGTSGESTRKVVVYRSFPDLPSIFDSAILAPGGLTK